MPGAEIPPLLAEPEFCVVSRRNDSFGSRARWRLFASLCMLSFAIAMVFAAFGAWLILPYSAVEMAVLYFAFRYFERHATDWERLTVSGDRLIVESERAGVRSKQEFNRYWVRIEVEPTGPSASGRGAGLALWYAGKRVAFGEALPAVERASTARQLRVLLRTSG
jgi:uncharacterized membrane protein